MLKHAALAAPAEKWPAPGARDAFLKADMSPENVAQQIRQTEGG
jgi:hypothetical protein